MEMNDLIFWTGIMADHAFFQVNAFSPREKYYVQDANQFHKIFSDYHRIAESQEVNESILSSMESDLTEFIKFKKKIIEELLRHDILINFSPGFVNHMVNEADEFLSLLRDQYSRTMRSPATYLKIWIADASGHSSSLLSSLDAAETLLLEKAQYHKKEFDDLYKKSVELEMIQNNIGVGDYLNPLKLETTQAMHYFIAFCAELIDLISNRNVLSIGTFGSEILSHFIREHEYVISKLAEL